MAVVPCTPSKERESPRSAGAFKWRRRESKLTVSEHLTARRGTTFGGNAFTGGGLRFSASST
jgi:hypothetical protein